MAVKHLISDTLLTNRRHSRAGGHLGLSVQKPVGKKVFYILDSRLCGNDGGWQVMYRKSK